MSKAELAKQIRTGQHIPDILDCLAQLSNDEVPTPPKLARAMLEILPAEVWGKADYVWLDPFCKSGVFLREIAGRLLEGLSDQIPDFEKRREHIYKNMLYGTSITGMTGIIARRSLYYSRDASGDNSVVRFDNSDGNLPFVKAHHTWPKKKDGTVTGGCTICGAPFDLERGEQRENYAYSFIHGSYPTEEMKDMKFDVIVGNPPYQMDDEGGHRPVPIYQHFVRKAKALRPEHILMITPSRWMAGGLGLNDYRKEMLAENRIVSLVDHPVASEVFPGVEIKGGVSYFLWSRTYSGPCYYTIQRNGLTVSRASRLLGSHDIFVRDNVAPPILARVTGSDEKIFSSLVASVRPFGDKLRSNFKGYTDSPTAKTDRPLLINLGGRREWKWTSDSLVTNNRELADSWKIFLPKAASDGGQRLPSTVIGKPILGSPREVSTETFLAIGPFASEEEANSALSYLGTRFARFLVSLRKPGQDNIPSTFAWLPQQIWDRMWSDDDLYEKYKVTAEEAAHIEAMVEECHFGSQR